ncbi:MAG: CorA family divalent cation transporter [Patescibacteria group bacterium]
MKQAVDNKVIWLDFLNPDSKNIEEIKKIHDFHPIILSELVTPSSYAKAEMYDSYIFFSYHIPGYNQSTKTSHKDELDFLITKDHVITVHYKNLEFLNEFVNEIKQNEEFENLVLGENTGKFVYHLLQKINNFCQRQLAHIETDLEFINKNIFTNKEHLMLREISYAKRNILNYSLIIQPQEILLSSFKEAGLLFWGQPMKIYFFDLIADHNRIIRQIENYRSTIESLEETNSQLFNSKTTAVMQRFTVLAFLTFPLALFTAIYNIPEVTDMLTAMFGSFWNSFGIMIALTLATLAVFYNKNWF